MGWTTWPVPNVDPELDRLVTDIQYEQLAQQYSGNGLYGDPSLPDLVYADNTGRHVKWRPHRLGLVQGHPWRSDGDGHLTAVANAAAARVDLAVLRFDRSMWQTIPTVRQGVDGGGVPAPVQDTDPTGAGAGMWELPVAKINVPVGSGPIPASAVTPLNWYLAPQPLAAKSSTMPPVRTGLQVWQHDLSRLVVGMGTSWHIVAESGPRTRLQVLPGWDTARNYVFFMRRNGWTFGQALVYRASNAGTVSAGTDLRIFEIPAQFRPIEGWSMYLSGFHGDAAARLYYRPETATVEIIAYPNPMQANAFVHVHPFAWPSA